MPSVYFVYRNLLYQVYSVPTLKLLICHLVTLWTIICRTKFIQYRLQRYWYAIWLFCVPKFVLPSLFCTNFKLIDMLFSYFVYRNLLYQVYIVPILKYGNMPFGYFVYRNLLYQVYSVPTSNLLICHLVTLCTEICCTKFILYQL